MRKSDGPCRVESAAVEKLLVKTEGGIALETQCALVGSEDGSPRRIGVIHLDSGWPKSVMNTARRLCDEIENHVTDGLFKEEGSNDRLTSGDGRPPIGLVSGEPEAELGKLADNEPEQL